MSETRYTRVPGTGRQFASIERLLLADDHLLLARRQLYIETYHRFFFSDIQALTLSGSRVREVAAAALGSLFLLTAWAYLASDGLGFKVFWGVLALGLIQASAVNWLRGPGVRCHLTTALQTIQLTPLNRRPQARKLLDEIAARIREAQARLPELETVPERAESETATERMPAPPRARAQPPPLPAAYNGFWHRLLFALLLVDSGVTYWQLQTDSLVADFFGAAVFLLELAVVVAAILRQRVLVVARPIRTLTWTTLSFMLLILVGGWVFGAYFGLTNALETMNGVGGQIDPIAAQVQAEPLSWFSLAATTTIGLTGLVLMSPGRRQPRASDLG